MQNGVCQVSCSDAYNFYEFYQGIYKCLTSCSSSYSGFNINISETSKLCDATGCDNMTMKLKSPSLKTCGQSCSSSEIYVLDNLVCSQSCN